MIKFLYFTGMLLVSWLMSTCLFTLFGCVIVFDSGDWSELIPFMWGESFGRSMFGGFLFILSPIISIVCVGDKYSKAPNES